jgi:hypothetical protein
MRFSLAQWCAAIAVFHLCWAMQANGQTFIGVSGGAAMPTTQYADQSELGIHGDVQYGIHRFCDFWPVLSLNYGRYQPKDTLSALTPSHPNAVSLQASMRWFPWGSQSLPLYAALGTGLSVITGEDDESVIGMHGSVEVGYLLFYKNPCCDWFITLSARYTAYNMLRDLDRPHLSGLGGYVGIAFPLGGGRTK